MKIKTIFLTTMALGLTACQTVKVKPENYSFQGDTVPLKVHSLEMRDYNYIPMLNTRSIKISVYNDRETCPDFNKEKEGYLFGQIINKKNHQNELRIPVAGKTYLKIENEWASSGNSYTCIGVIQFQAEKGKAYDLNLAIQKMGFKNKCPIQFKASTNGSDLMPFQFKNLETDHTLLKGFHIPKGQCS